MITLASVQNLVAETVVVMVIYKKVLKFVTKVS